FTGTTNGRGYVKSNFTATAAGQQASMATDGFHWFSVTPGESLTLQAGVEGTGAVGALQLVIYFQDANGVTIGSQVVSTLTGTQTFDTRISGTATVMAGAVKARLDLYVTSSAAGAGSFPLIEPTVVSDQSTALNRLFNSQFDGGTTGWANVYD